MDFACSSQQTDLQHSVLEAIGQLDSQALSEPPGTHEILTALGKNGAFHPWTNTDGMPDFLSASLIQEALSERSAQASSIFFVNSAAIAMLKRGGTASGDTSLVERAVSGELAFCFALTEPQAGSDAAAISTTATSTADGFVINGRKSYATGAGDADFILTVVRSSPDAPAKNGAAVLLVPGNAPGLTKNKLDKVAGNEHASYELVFDNVHVESGNLVGQLNRAWSLLFFGGLVERSLVAASAVGVSARAFDLTLQYLEQRTQFGCAITEFQAVSHKLADMRTQIEAMRWLSRYAAWQAQHGSDGPSSVNMAKLFTSETGTELVSECARLVGGTGYLRDNPVRQAAMQIGLSLYAGGSSEILKNGIMRAVTRAGITS